MSEIIKAKDGKLHIYVRQDTYKGKLKSENWVGRTFFKGKQKVKTDIGKVCDKVNSAKLYKRQK